MTTLSDSDLAQLARDGDDAAYSELWRRHWGPVRAAAARFSELADPDDIVQEAFTLLYQSLRHGQGPHGAVRPYLYRTVRNVAISMGRRKTPAPVGDSTDLDLAAGSPSDEGESDRVLEKTLTVRAFRSLPSRWQTVLWYTVVEDLPPRDVAPLMGMSANAVAALALRAREGLRTAWLTAHLRSESIAPECRSVVEQIAGQTHKTTGARDLDTIRDHVDSCVHCALVQSEVDDLARRLRGVLTPLLIGVTTAAWDSGQSLADPTALLGSAPTAEQAPHTQTPGGSGVARRRLRPRRQTQTRGSKQPLVWTTTAGVVVMTAAGVLAVNTLGGPRSIPTTDRPIAQSSTDPAPRVSSDPDPDPSVQPLQDATLDNTDTPTDQTTPPEPATVQDEAGPGRGAAATDEPVNRTPTQQEPSSSPAPSPAPGGPTRSESGSDVPLPAPPTLEPLSGSTALLTAPTISGTADPLAEISVIDTMTSEEVAHVAADEDGAWSAIPDPPQGTTSQYAATQTVNGQTSEPSQPSSIVTFTLPSIEDPADGSTVVFAADHNGNGIADEIDVYLSGEAGQYVEVLFDDVATGTLHLLEPTPIRRYRAPVAAGDHTVAVRYVDQATGSRGPLVEHRFSIDPDQPPRENRDLVLPL
ncbi:RNA polymerase sigma factor [Cellulosimicrobium composti]|uniref:RNA polymerase sigma factor n=1 Tax=Cellulosimicrobium composti TaxID=2672572 RepID=UPI0037B1E666